MKKISFITILLVVLFAGNATAESAYISFDENAHVENTSVVAGTVFYFYVCIIDEQNGIRGFNLKVDVPPEIIVMDREINYEGIDTGLGVNVWDVTNHNCEQSHIMLKYTCIALNSPSGAIVGIGNAGDRIAGYTSCTGKWMAFDEMERGVIAVLPGTPVEHMSFGTVKRSF